MAHTQLEDPNSSVTHRVPLPDGEEAQPERNVRSDFSFPEVSVPPLYWKTKKAIRTYRPSIVKTLTQKVESKTELESRDSVNSQPQPPKEWVPLSLDRVPPPPHPSTPTAQIPKARPVATTPAPARIPEPTQLLAPSIPPVAPRDLANPASYPPPTPTPKTARIGLELQRIHPLQEPPKGTEVPVTSIRQPIDTTQQLTKHDCHSKRTPRHYHAPERLPPRLDDRASVLNCLASAVRNPNDRWGGSFVRFAPQGIVFFKHNKIIYHNPSFLKALGYRQGSFVGYGIEEIFTNANRRQYRQQFIDVFSGDAPSIQFSTTLLTVEGPKKFKGTLSRVSGQKTSTVFAFSFEPEFCDSPFAGQEWYSEDLLDRLPVFLWVTDANSRLVKMNQATLDFFGIKVAPQPYTRTMTVEFHELATGPNRVSREGIHSEFINGNGVTRQILMNRIPWSKGSGWIYIAKDVTDLITR